MEKLLAVLFGFISGMVVYSGIGFYFTRKIEIGKRYRYKLILFSSLLTISIILKIVLK